jgi:BON domain
LNTENRWSKHSLLNATVQGGTVKLWGVVDSEAEKEAAWVPAQQVAGVQAIENNVIVQPVRAGSIVLWCLEFSTIGQRDRSTPS